MFSDIPMSVKILAQIKYLLHKKSFLIFFNELSYFTDCEPVCQMRLLDIGRNVYAQKKAPHC